MGEQIDVAIEASGTPRVCPECSHKSGATGICQTCKPYGRECVWCLYGSGVPTDAVPPVTDGGSTTQIVGEGVAEPQEPDDAWLAACGEIL